MAIKVKISGDDVPGEWDSELTAASPLIVADTISGVPWYRVSSSAATKIIGKSPLGSPATTYFGFRYRASGNPASSQVFLHPFTSGGATAFRLRRGSTGTIILDGASTNGLDTSAVTAVNTDYVFIGSVSATVATVTIYAVDGVTVIDTITATNTFGLVDNWRMGQIGGSPALPDWWFRMLLVGDAPITPADVLATPVALGSPRFGALSDSNGFENGAGPTHYFTAFTNAGIATRDVYYGGVGGKRIAVPDLTGKTSANNISDAQTWLGSIDTWIIALGTNDRPQSDATINADIDTLLAAIGPTPKVVWIGLTSKGSASVDDIRVNGLIQAKLTARGNAVFADWNTHIRGIDGGANPSPYWLTTDTTHMTPLGYQERAAFYAAQLVDDEPVDVDGAGTLVLAGSATVGATVTRTATGALGLTGSTTRSTAITRAASDSLVLDGAADTTVSVTRTAVGGLALSGSASTSGGTDRNAEGALSLTGTATGTVSVNRTATQSLALGGVGAVTFEILRTALGTLTLTGSATHGDRAVIPDRLTLTEVAVSHSLTPLGVNRTLEDA